MTYDECLNKAKEALRLGIIEFEQLETYAKHLYERYNGKN